MDEPLLLIETSGRGGAVGLAAGGALRERHLDPARRHARDLAPAVAELLTEAGLNPRDVRRIGVGIGPGSFTGLRVGIMSAKAFAYATGCELVAVPTFAALTVHVTDPAVVDLEVVADGLQGLIYVEGFRRGPTGWHPRSPLELRPVKEWAIDWECGSNSRHRLGLVGPGLAVAGAVMHPDVRRFDVAAPSLLALWATARTLAPLSRDGMLALEPLYLRGSSAEEKAALGRK